MPNTQLYTAISTARFKRYNIACENNRRKAIKLYRANLLLSQKMYGVISVFEVILRNSIDRQMIKTKGDTWLEDAVSPGGYLEINSGCEDSFHNVHEAIEKLGVHYTHDELIAKFTLGFWTYQFAPKQFAASGSKLLDIFPKRPFNTKQKDIFKKLIKINDIRNRIANHEPICFDGNRISIDKTQRRYKYLLELLTWLGCDCKRILYGINGVSKTFTKVTIIKSYSKEIFSTLNNTPNPSAGGGAFLE